MDRNKLITVVIVCAVSASLWGQQGGGGGVKKVVGGTSISVSPSSGIGVVTVNSTLTNVTNDAQTKASVVPNTAPSAGQIPVGNAGGTAYAPSLVSGDCSLASTGAITCTKTNTVSLTALATTAPGTGVATFLATPSSANLRAALTDETGTGVALFGGAAMSNLTARYWSCQSGVGDGLNAVTAGTYLQSFCYNDTGSTITLTGLKCFTDNAGTSTMNASNGAGTGLLTGAVTCSTSFAAGTQSATTTIASGDYIKFTFVADGTSKQTTWVVSGTF